MVEGCHERPVVRQITLMMRLESESLEPLIDSLALLGQKLSPKNVNLDKNVKRMICLNKANLCPTTILPPIELERRSNPLKMREVMRLD